jgi:predicted esterase
MFMTEQPWQIQHHVLHDHGSLKTIRRVTIAIPASAKPFTRVVYCADGQVIETFASALTTSLDGDLPILIGIHSDARFRAQEYLLSSDEHFLAHERFWTDQVRKWAQCEFGVSPERGQSVAFGFSNGGAFALAAVLRQPHLFAAVLSFSTTQFASREIPPPGGLKPSIYMAAGNQGPEKSIRKNVLRIARWLRQNDLPVTVSLQAAGHTLDFWVTEFVKAVEWLNAQST